MGLATESNNISVYKACIKNANKLKNPTHPFLFGKSNRLNLGPISNFLSILTAVEKLLIAYIYIFIYKSYVYIASNITILAIFTALAVTALVRDYYGPITSLLRTLVRGA